MIDEGGRVTHANECLMAAGTQNPNFEVLRELWEAIGQDQGTVLHWYDYERTILRSLAAEIENSDIADSDELLLFLEELGLEKNVPKRLRDMGRLVSDYVFLPGTGGSSSVKRVLPALIHFSDFLRTKYGAPIYGTEAMPSLNFTKQAWAVSNNGGYLDPYDLLSRSCSVSDRAGEFNDRDRSKELEAVSDGADAIVAYTRLQDLRVSAAEKAELARQLKRYCELDTLAMVMVYEAIREWLS
jgi:hypothetical protein